MEQSPEWALRDMSYPEKLRVLSLLSGNVLF